MIFDKYYKNKNEREEEIEMTKSLDSSDSDEYFTSLFRFQSQLKIMHWGTTSYAGHQAYGLTYDTIDKLLDNLVESYQGIYGNLTFSQCGFIEFKDVDVDKWLNDIMDSINSFRNELKEDELKNQLDEIGSSVSKLKYLLTLK